MEYDRKTEGMKEIMITIADVAREAGVSVATVSRVPVSYTHLQGSA